MAPDAAGSGLPAGLTVESVPQCAPPPLSLTLAPHCFSATFHCIPLLFCDIPPPSWDVSLTSPAGSGHLVGCERRC